MAQIPLIGKDNQGTYPINLFVDPEREDGRPALVGTPGLKTFCSTGYATEIRGMKVCGSYLYAVVGNKCYRINSEGTTATEVTGTLNTTVGHVFMEWNGTQLMIVDGLHGYIVTTTTLTEISDEDFPVPSSLTYQDTYFIVTEKDTGRQYISGNNDGTTWDALDFTTAEGAPDSALCVFSDHRELFMFGETTTEPYYNSGDADYPFERISGAYMETGIGAAASPVRLDNSVFWLSNNLQVVRASGYVPKVISTRQIDAKIAGYSRADDAIGMGIVHRGHAFYVLAFPTADKTWCYDASTGMWHQRSSYPTIGCRWRGNCYAYFNKKHLVGDFENGIIYEIDFATFTDNSQAISSRHIFPPVINQKKEVVHNSFEIEFKAGVGLATGQGSDPMAMLDWSDDNQRTWSNELWRSIGKAGEFNWKAKWNGLGRSEHREYRVTITDPIERIIYAPYLEFEGGD